jgi:hypothetical protein
MTLNKIRSMPDIDFRLSRLLLIDVNSVLALLHRVVVRGKTLQRNGQTRDRSEGMRITEARVRFPAEARIFSFP